MVIDLRSDTVTRPTVAMREAMAYADVGDDVYGEDPTAQKLEARAAELLGKEATLFVPSGTMANQIALLLHCRKGDEVIVGEGAHCMFYESGAGAAWAGVQFAVAGAGGLYTAEEMETVVRPLEYHLPRTALVAVENTHNRAGGRVFPQREVQRIAERARAHGLAVHLDGARLWNASVATGAKVAELTAPFDTVSACFSKGLGAPAGSVIAGTRAHVLAARRFRKMLGGGMRQVGVLAAAALYALDHHLGRLAEDHAAARALGTKLAGCDAVRCDLATVETNIVAFDTPHRPAADVAKRAAAEGVLVNAMGPRRIRAVTHLDVTLADATRAADVLARAAAA